MFCVVQSAERKAKASVYRGQTALALGVNSSAKFTARIGEP